MKNSASGLGGLYLVIYLKTVVLKYTCHQIVYTNDPRIRNNLYLYIYYIYIHIQFGRTIDGW